jgi:hypothetical protein
VVIVVARDADRGIIEALGDQSLYLGRFHWTRYRLVFRGRAVYPQTCEYPNALVRLCMIADPSRPEARETLVR